jgi:hypothetical protein
VPFRNLHNCSVAGGFGNGGINGSKESLGYGVKDGAVGGISGFSDVILRASDHWVGWDLICRRGRQQGRDGLRMSRYLWRFR